MDNSLLSTSNQHIYEKLKTFPLLYRKYKNSNVAGFINNHNQMVGHQATFNPKEISISNDILKAISNNIIQIKACASYPIANGDYVYTYKVMHPQINSCNTIEDVYARGLKKRPTGLMTAIIKAQSNSKATNQVQALDLTKSNIKSNIIKPNDAMSKDPVSIEVTKTKRSRSPYSLEFKYKVANKYKSLLQRSMETKKDFNLDLRDIARLLERKTCYYTGVKFDNESNLRTIDRVDNKKGYVKGNVVACLQEINSIKSVLFECDDKLVKDKDLFKKFINKFCQ